MVRRGGRDDNEPHGNNRLKEKFTDFRLDAEYKVSPRATAASPSRPLRMQVLDDAAGTMKGARTHVHLLGKPPRERQQGSGRVADRANHRRRQCVSATLNGRRSTDNSKIADHGGALDPKETEPVRS